MVPKRCFLYCYLPIYCPASFLQSTAQGKKTCTWLSSPLSTILHRPGKGQAGQAGGVQRIRFPQNFAFSIHLHVCKLQRLRSSQIASGGHQFPAVLIIGLVWMEKNLQKLRIGNGQINAYTQSPSKVPFSTVHKCLTGKAFFSGAI